MAAIVSGQWSPLCLRTQASIPLAGRLLGADMPAFSAVTRELLGWNPSSLGSSKTSDQGHYFVQARGAAAWASRRAGSSGLC